MKDAIALFSELGNRLRDFGTDAPTCEVITRACRTNGWFTPRDVRRAVATLTDTMLREALLGTWLSRYSVPVRTPRRVLVVMAGNIPLVGFFDLLCVLAAGHRCLIKPSAKDTVLMEYVVGLLRRLEPELPVRLYDGREAVDAVIATGGENANRYFRTQYAGIPALLRGHRQSVAVLSGHENPEQLVGLSDDIWAYSGLGCRNVSLVFLPRGCRPAWHMPAGMNPKYIRNYLQEKAVLTLTGTPFLDLGGAVAVEQQTFPTALSRIAYAYYDTAGEVAAWLAGHDAELQCVVSESVAHSRRVDFGCAQSPALADYPDDLDVMAFLTTSVSRIG